MADTDEASVEEWCGAETDWFLAAEDFKALCLDHPELASLVQREWQQWFAAAKFADALKQLREQHPEVLKDLRLLVAISRDVIAGVKMTR